MEKIKIGLVGGAGYTAGELIRLLVNHPYADIVFCQSSSQAGKRITDVHGGLLGECDLRFSEQAELEKADVLFICSGHGDSRVFMESHNLPASLKIIDLSQDYRDESEGFVYGLPEWQKTKIAQASRIANPGCFATAIQLALLPLAAKGLLREEVHVCGTTGSTGAGVKPSATTHFSWRNDNLSAYKVFNHQHLIEINRNLRQLQPSFDRPIRFIPLRGDFARGIFVSAYTACDLSQEEAVALYEDFYRDAAFTHVVEGSLDMKQAVNTNKALIHVEKHDDTLVVFSAIDNLLKGASGQAVQNMNLMFSIEETCGLQLKNIGF